MQKAQYNDLKSTEKMKNIYHRRLLSQNLYACNNLASFSSKQVLGRKNEELQLSVKLPGTTQNVRCNTSNVIMSATSHLLMAKLP